MSITQFPNVTDKLEHQNQPATNSVAMPSYADLLIKEAQRQADPHYQQVGTTTVTPAFVPANDPSLVAQHPQPQAVPAQPQPEQHSAAYQPYPNPGYVPEATHTVAQQVVANTDAESVNAVTLKIDGESMKILMNANEIFRETIVNIGIKLASQTSVYRDYFKMEDLRLTGVVGGVSPDYGVVDTPSVTTTESISRVGSSIGSTYGNTEADPKVPTLKKKAPGFGNWA